MPWEPGHNLGFSNAAQTWLPVGHETSDTVAVQRTDPGSHLHAVRALIAMRRALPALPDAVTWPDTPDELVAFVRGDHLFVLNVADGPIGWEPGGTWQIVHRTGADRVPAATTEREIVLSGGEAMVARRI